MKPLPWTFLPTLALGLAAAALLRAAPRDAAPPLMLGAAWYPEQWPESQWDHDLGLMQRAGLNVVRIGEFAWSSEEPAEGRYELDWMERAIAAAARHGVRVIIGTPSDAPPAWLTSKYPEVLRVDENGQRAAHGGRRQFSYASPKYREFCAKLAAQLGQRFGHNPDVIAWQVGNEFTEDSYDPAARAQFHAWLQRRYGTLDALNQHWVTAYWSQTYSDWEQVPMPTGRANPGLLLDYKHFVTDTWRSFLHNQSDVLRKLADPRQLLTTNLGGLGWADRFNRQVIAADLDVIAWDDYLGAGYDDPAKNGTGHLNPDRAGSTHDLVRGWKQKNFWVMELPPGFVDWSSVSNSLDRGETRAMTWHAIGHGADLVAFWQWRSALNGQEQYHGSLVGPDGEPVPVYAEIAQAGADFARAGPVLAGTSPVSAIAILHDYDSRWAVDFNRFTLRYNQLEVLESYYKAYHDLTQSVDIVVPTADLSGYKLVVAPTLNVVSPALAERLAAYVRAGGHLLLGPRTGMKNEFNALNPERQPGPLKPAVGARVEQFYALLGDNPVAGDWGTGQATIWAETLDELAPDTKVVLRYGPGNAWLADQPAAVTRALGRGTITYLGALLDPKLTAAMAQATLAAAGVPPSPLAVTTGVSVSRRVGAGHEVYVLTNFSTGPQEIALPGAYTDVLNGGVVARVALPRYGVAVLSRPLP